VLLAVLIGLPAVAGAREGGDLLHPGPRAMQQPEADERVPEAEDRPGQPDAEADEDHDVRDRPAAGAQHMGHEGHHAKIGRDVHGGDERAPAAERAG